ncbi:FAD binding domain-containing protein [Aquisalimonas lutea]|uniref:FAD binding domain-containing protein n=1 Tax=Aquisalimonas lutea TaxID=1327750 RepID=UPI0025B489CC|nr:FAD binding domain-containing protein [Aquisalimonas lutea]MDN3516536.1 FAD binding domain-containing protein [Aquisalimonas lutea]
MKPAPFDYVRATTRDEVLTLLAEGSEQVRVLAGGQSLMAVLNMRFAQPGLLVDITAVEELRRIERRGDTLVVGAAVRQAELLAWPGLAETVPLVARALPWVGHYQTRNRGTIGGSLVHADPSAELPLCLATLGGSVVLESRRRRRTVPADDFFQGVLTTAREPDEVLTEVHLPVARPGSRFGFREVAMRHGDFALVALAAEVRGDEAWLGVGGVADRPVVRRMKPGAALADDLDALAWELGGEDDGHASARYRRQLVRELGYTLLTETAP